MRRTALISAAVGTLLVAATLAVLPRLQPWWTDVVLDSREPRVPCAQRPSAAAAQRVLDEHRELVRRIEAVDPSVLVTLDESACPGRGTLVVLYGAHRHREQIRRLIGGDSFFGVPYALRNV
jgi:hypothetical protein